MKSDTSYLEYYKTILSKINFDRSLFVKEYNKALKLLNEPEQRKLQLWIKNNLKSNYHEMYLN